MRNTLIVALREFKQRVTSRAFLMGAIGTPLILLAISLFTGAFTPETGENPLEDVSEARESGDTIGYVDQAGLIDEVREPVPAAEFSADLFRAYAEIEAAEEALAQGDIAAYYVVPPDYRETGEVRRVSPRFPTAPPDTELFKWLLISNLLPGKETAQIRTLRWPFGGGSPAFVSLSPESGAEEEGSGNTMLPFAATIAVIIPLYTGAGYLFQSLTQEKSNRVMEILLVSLRPRQLLTGKLIGLGALTLVQYAIWIVIGVVAMTVTGQGPARVFSAISLSGREALLVVPYALGGFGLYAAVMAGIGALSPDMESSRAWLFVLTLPMMIPIYLWQPIASHPDGALATALSLFPPSAPVAMLMRMTASAVPTWQFGVGLSLLLVSVVGTIWLMARLFHAQTLLSGESLSLRRFWAALTAT